MKSDKGNALVIKWINHGCKNCPYEQLKRDPLPSMVKMANESIATMGPIIAYQTSAHYKTEKWITVKGSAASDWQPFFLFNQKFCIFSRETAYDVIRRSLIKIC